MKPSKKPKYRLDPKKFEGTMEKKKKQKESWGEDMFTDALRSKPRRRH